MTDPEWSAAHDVARVVAHSYEAAAAEDMTESASDSTVGGFGFKRRPALYGPTYAELSNMGTTYKTFQKRFWAWLKIKHPKVGLKTGSKLLSNQWQQRKIQMGGKVSKKRRQSKKKKKKRIIIKIPAARDWLLADDWEYDTADWDEIYTSPWMTRYEQALLDGGLFRIGPFRYKVASNPTTVKTLLAPVLRTLVEDLRHGSNQYPLEVINGSWDDAYTATVKSVRVVVGINNNTGRRWTEAFVQTAGGGWYHSPRITQDIRRTLSLS